MKQPHVPATPGRQAAIALAGSVAITLAMFLIPSPENTWWLLAPFRWLHIYVHEFGHGVAALLAGGQFDKFEMYTYSGLAYTRTTGSLASAFVCAGGLCGPAVVGGVFLATGRNPRWARVALAGFGAFMAVSLVLWTRTPFGWGFGATVAALSLLVALRARPAMAQSVLVFLGVQLALSVYTGGGYLFTQYVEIQNGHRGPSDTQAMAEAIGLPFWFWGAVCGAFSALVLLAGLWMYIRPGRSGRAAPNARFAAAA
ncbi:MAG TPA: M50 family metallopeptidase [Kofleriaceae bacterium]|nr:M50 family metallopeptidase [Kofleriaceae bacterium]